MFCLAPNPKPFPVTIIAGVSVNCNFRQLGCAMPRIGRWACQPATVSWIDRGAATLIVSKYCSKHRRLHDEKGETMLPSLDSYRRSRSCIPSFTSTLFPSFTLSPFHWLAGLRPMLNNRFLARAEAAKRSKPPAATVSRIALRGRIQP